jgi:hypothetical protein
LAELDAIDLQLRNAIERKAPTACAELLEIDSVIFEGNAPDVHGQAGRLPAPAVNVEVGELERGHGQVYP